MFGWIVVGLVYLTLSMTGHESNKPSAFDRRGDQGSSTGQLEQKD